MFLLWHKCFFFTLLGRPFITLKEDYPEVNGLHSVLLDRLKTIEVYNEECQDCALLYVPCNMFFVHFFHFDICILQFFGMPRRVTVDIFILHNNVHWVSLPLWYLFAFCNLGCWVYSQRLTKLLLTFSRGIYWSVVQLSIIANAISS